MNQMSIAACCLLQVQLVMQQLEASRAQLARLESDLRDYKARAQVRGRAGGGGCKPACCLHKVWYGLKRRSAG